MINTIEVLWGEKTLLIAAQRLSTVRTCDRLVFLCNDRIAGYESFDELPAPNVDFHTLVALADLKGAGA